MAALVIPGALQVVIKGTNLGTNWANVWGVYNPDPFLLDQSIANDIADAFFDGYALDAASRTFGWSLDSIEVRDLRTATSPSWDAVITPFSGSNAGDAMPPQTAVVLSHRTGLRGKSYNGRTYMNGWVEVSNDGDGSVDPALRTALLAEVAAIEAGLAAVTGGPFELAVLSRKLLVATPITSTTVDSEWDRQDRRKRR